MSANAITCLLSGPPNIKKKKAMPRTRKKKKIVMPSSLTKGRIEKEIK